jgi:gliding motility-associated-like protein
LGDFLPPGAILFIISHKIFTQDLLLYKFKIYLLYKFQFTMQGLKAISLVASFILFSLKPVQSQIQVSDTATLTQAIESLISEGVQISNISSNCHNMAWGTFADTSGYLGIDEGLVLASGSIFDIPGPNNLPGSGLNLLQGGDADLSAIVGAVTNDACYVQFDVTPSADTLVFNYVFGSEEYDEFVCSAFNDVFAFLISGPGITGKKNIALIPGTTTPVSINNVNQGNGPLCPAQNQNYFISNPTNSPEIQYDGNTVVLQAMTPVIPCETYTLKLAIADVADGILDSGVFIEKGSLGSFGAEITPSSAYARFSYGVEGCNAGKFIFIRTIADTFAVPLRWELTGTATNGIDYVDEFGNPIGNIDTIPSFQDSLELFVFPILDTIYDPIETIVLTLFDPCDDTTQTPTGDSVVLLIREEFIYNAGPDDSICVGDIIELNSNFFLGDSVFWSPPTGLSCTNCPNPFANPVSDIIYVLQVFDSVTNCPASDSLSISVFDYPDPDILAISDSTGWVCEGSYLKIISGLEQDSLYNYLTFDWDSTLSIVGPRDTSIIWVSPSSNIYYFLNVTNPIGCITRDSIKITVIPWPEVEFLEDLEICFGSQVQVNPDLGFFPGVGYSYSWTTSPSGSLAEISDTTISNPIISPINEGKTRYTLSVFNGICESSSEVKIDVEDEILVEYAYEDLGDFLKIPKTVSFENKTASSFKYEYKWLVRNTETGKVDSFISENLEYEFWKPDLYEVSLIATEPKFNCVERYEEEFQFEQVVRPNLITPNGDGKNDYFIIEAPTSQTWQLRIYDRWGALVFESNDYMNNWGGLESQAGVYYYEMWNPERDERFTGYLEVLR